MDTLDPQQRSVRMALVRGKDTKPELIVRQLVHRLGFRYRLHGRDLPGTPDVVFPRRGKVIFVHGCFWHRHAGCGLARLPKSRGEFWSAKLVGNVDRDSRSVRALRRLGWGVMTIWECQLSNTARLASRIWRFLNA